MENFPTGVTLDITLVFEFPIRKACEGHSLSSTGAGLGTEMPVVCYQYGYPRYCLGVVVCPFDKVFV